MENIKNHPTMIKALADSYGGIMYNVANQDKYEGANSLLKLWDALSPAEQEMADGITKGAIDFLQGAM